MEAKRVFLLAMLGLTLIMLWQAWEQRHVTANSAGNNNGNAVTTQQTSSPMQPSMPTIAGDTLVIGSDADTSLVETAQMVTVETDVLRVAISTEGGTVTSLGLKAYPETVADNSPPYALLLDTPDDVFLAQTGLVSTAAAPSHRDLFTAEQLDYRLVDGEQTVRVPLSWQDSASGVYVTKTYVFTRGSYVVDVEYQVTNAGDSRWDGAYYGQFRRRHQNGSSWLMPTFVGGAVYHDKYEKFSMKKLREDTVNIDARNGWSAMVQHHFFAAFLPPRDQTFNYYSLSPQGGDVVLGTRSPAFSVAPGETQARLLHLYAGPKDQGILETLEPLADKLYLTADYGWLSFIARYLFLFLRFIHDIVGNWPLAIILLTVLIKLAFYKLSETSYRSMARMRQVAPRIQAIKERIGDDRKQLQQEMMRLYREEKINPMSGCLPILVQIPVFIALYWVLLESVEMRQASFFWIQDITLRDPLYILPLIMAGTMFLQQRLSPKPPDPIQAKMMMLLPIVFSVMFFFFPAGLVLYWVVNNSLSIAQQWLITRRIEHGDDDDKKTKHRRQRRKK